jgi:hypothetical protein
VAQVSILREAAQARRRVSYSQPNEDEDDDDRGRLRELPDSTSGWFDDDAEDHEQQRAAAIGIVQSIIAGWPDYQFKAVVKLIWDAEAAGEVLSNEEVATALRAGGWGGSPSTIRTWRLRGFRRLQADLRACGYPVGDFAKTGWPSSSLSRLADDITQDDTDEYESAIEDE